jgi:nucleotide-binding universal stress UspA family protein
MQRLTLRVQGFPHRTYVRYGRVSDILSAIFRANDIGMLVAGTHGRTGLDKLVMS